MHNREENCGQNGAKDSVHREVRNQGPLRETLNNSVVQNGASIPIGMASRNWRSSCSYYKGSFKPCTGLDFLLQVIRNNQRISIRVDSIRFYFMKFEHVWKTAWKSIGL